MTTETTEIPGLADLRRRVAPDLINDRIIAGLSAFLELRGRCVHACREATSVEIRVDSRGDVVVEMDADTPEARRSIEHKVLCNKIPGIRFDRMDFAAGSPVAGRVAFD